MKVVSLGFANSCIQTNEAINSTFESGDCCPQVSGNSGLQDRLVGLYVGIARSLYTPD